MAAIKDYPEAESLSDNDLLLIDTGATGYKSIKKSTLMDIIRSQLVFPLAKVIDSVPWYASIPDYTLQVEANKEYIVLADMYYEPTGGGGLVFPIMWTLTVSDTYHHIKSSSSGIQYQPSPGAGRRMQCLRMVAKSAGPVTITMMGRSNFTDQSCRLTIIESY